ncbi:MAG: alpha/beta hydrolase [Gammaproteobacteria bacterium]
MNTQLATLFLRAPHPLIAAWYFGRRVRHGDVTLDPKAQLVAWVVRQFRTENVAEAGAPKVREMFRRAVEVCGEPGLPVHKVEERRIPGGGGDFALRLFYPRAGEKPLPVVLYFHGGGFVVGDLDSYSASARRICVASGAIVAMPDYRLAPEARFPAGVNDCLAATRWIAANAQTFGGDPSRLAISGDSAGGCLVAVVSQICRDEGGPELAYQAMLYPMMDWFPNLPSIEAFGNFDLVLTNKRLRWMESMYLDDSADRDDPRVAPVRATDFSNLPPAALVTTGFDPVLDEGLLYGEKLREAGVPVAHRHYPTQLHGFTFLGKYLPEAQDALDFIGHRLREALHRESSQV